MFYQVSQEDAYLVCGALASYAAALERDLLVCPPRERKMIARDLVRVQLLRDKFYDDGSLRAPLGPGRKIIW